MARIPRSRFTVCELGRAQRAELGGDERPVDLENSLWRWAGGARTHDQRITEP